MVSAQIPRIHSNESSRCEERSHVIDHRKSLSPIQKTDATIKESIDQAFWKDNVLRAIEYYEIDVHVRNGIAYLSGHIASTTSQNRINDALRAIPGLLGIQNDLVLDDRLTNEVATGLAKLEHTYNCKFFTGASHGVVSLNGFVRDEYVKLLAEKCAASNPNVRAVINNVRVSGSEVDLPAQTFLQPTIGQIVYFLDGISGVVRHVIINPDNRRVVAMILWGKFVDQRQGINSPNYGEAAHPERLVFVSVDVVRYMTDVSGFLLINSNQNTRYWDFDPARFSEPQNDWKAPYPYCPEDVLFPLEKHSVKYQNLEQPLQPPLTAALNEQLLWEQLLANENPGG